MDASTVSIRQDERLGHGSVTSHVVESVVELLRSGRYQIGDRLPSEWELVATLGVGRSAVREAMRELATLELVEIRRGSGTYVRHLRPDLLLRPESLAHEADRRVVEDLLEVRLIVEPEAAALAAQRATSADIDRLRHDLERLEEAIGAGYRPPEDLGFHLNLVRAAHNDSLTRVANAIVLFYNRDNLLPSQRDVRQHGNILAGVIERDSLAAKSEMRAHLEEEVLLHGNLAERESARTVRQANGSPGSGRA